MDEHRDIDVCLKEADALKVQGNDYFRSAQWNEALVAYQAGVGQLPKRPLRAESSSTVEDLNTSEASHNQENRNDIDQGQDVVTEYSTIEIPPKEAMCSKARAVLNANIGACYVKLGDYKLAVEACSQALLDDPHYVKALQRRALSNEKLDSWSSLTSAQEDYTALLTILPPGSPLIKEIERSLRLLKPRLEASQKKETAEMMDKLKGLGNSILGNFGLSTDNFKFVPNGQGGYSVNFSQ